MYGDMLVWFYVLLPVLVEVYYITCQVNSSFGMVVAGGGELVTGLS